MTSPSNPSASPQARSVFRRVAVPAEHGGWALTAEPVLLGLLVAPSVAGVALAVAAFLAFLVRTPVTVVLVDRHRERWLPRTTIAARVAAIEAVLVVALVAVALLTGSARWLLLLAIAAPLVAVELDFDLRSRSRRLLPELCGAVGIGAVVACILLAAGEPAELAVALWLVMAGRSVASIPFARTEIERLHDRPVRLMVSDGAQVVGVALAVGATVLERLVLPGLIALGLLAGLQVVALRCRPLPAVVLGVGQSVAGLVIVLVTAAAVRW
jgi:YwiC-like protein